MKNLSNIRCMYFSPCYETKKVAEIFAKQLSFELNIPYTLISYTLPEQRRHKHVFSRQDILIIASPVYAGRIPNKTLDYLTSSFSAENTLSVPLVTFGGRNFDNALSELKDIMLQNNCIPIAGAAIVTRHVFSELLAYGRPNDSDCKDIIEFTRKVAKKIRDNDMFSPIDVPYLQKPYQYYVPRKEDGTKADFLKAKPQINNDKCTLCGCCVELCPMGTVKKEDRGIVFNGICIKCQACRLNCPVKAIYFDDKEFLSHVAMLE